MSTNEQLLLILRIASIIGMIAFNVFIIFLIYTKLRVYYPKKVEKLRWLFAAVAMLLSGLMIFIFNKFYVTNRLGVQVPREERQYKIPKLY